MWNRTIITIAHRISTISDYDRVIVMDNGNIVEEGHPHELIEQEGLFSEMVNHSEGKEEIVSTAKRNYQRGRKA